MATVVRHDGLASPAGGGISIRSDLRKISRAMRISLSEDPQVGRGERQLLSASHSTSGDCDRRRQAAAANFENPQNFLSEMSNLLHRIGVTMKRKVLPVRPRADTPGLPVALLCCRICVSPAPQLFLRTSCAGIGRLANVGGCRISN